MICQTCQHEILEGEMFCSYCGARVKTAPVPVPQVPQVKEPEKQVEGEVVASAPQKGGRNVYLVLLLVASVFLCVVSIGLLVAYLKADEQAEEAMKLATKAQMNYESVLPGGLLVQVDSVSNADQQGNLLSTDLNADTLQYLHLDLHIFTIESLYTYHDDLLYVSVYKPNGELMQGQGSTASYTFTKEITSTYSSVGWGNSTGGAYTHGFYVIVFVYDGVTVGKEAVFVE